MTTLEQLLADLGREGIAYDVDDAGNGLVALTVEGACMGTEVTLVFRHGKLLWMTGCCNPEHRVSE